MTDEKNRRRIRLLATDLDGTLLTEEKVVTKRTRRAICAAQDKGVEILIATGRPLNAIPPGVLSLDGVRYIMASNGAIIYDRKEKKTIWHKCIARESAKKIREIISPLPIWKEFSIDGIAYTEEGLFSDIESHLPEGLAGDYLRSSRIPKENLEEFLEEHADQLEKVCMFFRNPGDSERYEKLFTDLPDIFRTSAMWYNLELSDIKAEKGCALTFMEETLGVTSEETMAFGDNRNDITMIQAAGLGVAMENGHEDLKVKADYVTLSNEEDGVAAAIEKFILGPSF